MIFDRFFTKKEKDLSAHKGWYTKTWAIIGLVCTVNIYRPWLSALGNYTKELWYLFNFQVLYEKPEKLIFSERIFHSEFFLL